MRTSRLLTAALSLFCLLALLPGCDKPAPKANLPNKGATAPVPHPAPVVQKAWPPTNSKELPIADNLLARNYCLVLDASGSMGERGCSGERSKLDAAKAALLQFAKRLPAEANLGLLVFTRSQVSTLIDLGRNNLEQIVTVLDTIRASGGTPLANAVASAYQKLEEQAIRQLGYGEFNLVVITDGIADSGQDPGEVVLGILRDTPIQVHTIGFCIGPDHSLNMPGRTVYREANNPEELRRGLEEVLAETESFDLTDFK